MLYVRLNLFGIADLLFTDVRRHHSLQERDGIMFPVQSFKLYHER